MKLITKFYESRNCIVCLNIFHVAKRSRGTKSKHHLLRGRNSKTCSSECSKKYHRNRQRYIIVRRRKSKSKGLYSGMSYDLCLSEMKEANGRSNKPNSHVIKVGHHNHNGKTNKAQSNR